MSLGMFIREVREANGWTQKEIADRANNYLGTDTIDQARVSSWERDRRKNPDADHIRMLSAVYRRPVVDLLIAAGYVTRIEAERWAEGEGAPPISHLPPEMAEFQDIGRAVDDVRRRLAALQERLDAQDRPGRESSQSAGR